ncbi:hypothetical protein EPN42_01500 [bacterium]|nr:MAG: hypothetical protein EPN42_01500 [bacterium]
MKPFFANARLAALPHAPVSLSPDSREGAREVAYIGPRIPSFTLCVARTDLEPALSADRDLARCLTNRLTAARLAQLLLAPPATRAQALTKNPSLHEPLAILHAKALAELDPERGGSTALFRIPPTLARYIHAPLESALLPAALRTRGPSELQRRIGIVPLDGEGQLVHRASGTIMALHALVSTSDGRRIFAQRLTPEHRIVTPPGAPRNLAALEIHDGFAPTRPIAGLLAVVEAPSGDRTVVPLHGVASTQVGAGSRSDRFAVDPTRTLIEAMGDGRRVTFESARERFGITLAIEAPQRPTFERNAGPAAADHEPIMVDGKIAESFVQPERRAATRGDVVRPRIAQLAMEGLSVRDGFIEAMEGNQPHRLPLHTLPAEARAALERGESYHGLFIIAPQLFTQSLSYQAVTPVLAHDRRANDYERVLDLDLRAALPPRSRDLPMHLVAATSYEPIPESAPARLVLRTRSFGYYAIEGPDRTTIVEYAPHGRPTTTLARFASDNDQNEMDEAAAGQSSRRRHADLNEPLALPTSGMFTGDGSRWTILPTPDAQEGLAVLTPHEVEVIGIQDVSRPQRYRVKERDVIDQDEEKVIVAPGTAVPRADIARLTPDQRYWQVLHADQERIYLIDPVAEGPRVVLALGRDELTDEGQSQLLHRGDVLRLGRTTDRYLPGDSYLTMTIESPTTTVREAPSLSR